MAKPIHTLMKALGAVMIGIVLDFGARSVMYLVRMNKGKWKYLKV